MVKGGMEKAIGRIVIQDMLSKGSGKHILWSPNGGCEHHLRCRGGSERRMYGWQ